MTTALQAPPSLRDRCKEIFLASAAWGSVHLHYSGVTDRIMQAAHPEVVRFPKRDGCPTTSCLTQWRKRRRP
jgi:hypothetical protein